MKKTTLLLLLVLSLNFSLNSQNSCASALMITEDATTTVGSIDGNYNASCWGSDATNGEWYVYTATLTGVINISTNLPQNDGITNSNDTRVSVFTGASCTALTCYTGSDDIDGSNYLTDLTFTCEIGTTYYFLWDDVWNGNGFDFILTETAVNCPDGTLPITEDFSDTNRFLVCWENIDDDLDGQSWYTVDYDLDESGQPDGNPCLASNSWNGSPLFPDNWLISYPIDLTTYTVSDMIDLTWIARGIDPAFPAEQYHVYAANSNLISNLEPSPVNFSETLVMGGEGGGDWTPTRTLDISSLAGQMVYVAFRHFGSSDEFVLNIDDVTIGAVLGIEDNVLSKIKIVALDKSIVIYNLPETTNYSIYNISGQEVLKGTTENKDYVIEATAMASGVYIVELSDARSNAVIRKKVVLQ